MSKGTFYRDFPQYPNGEHVEAVFLEMEKMGLVKGQDFKEGRGYAISERGIAWLNLLLSLHQMNTGESED